MALDEGEAADVNRPGNGSIKAMGIWTYCLCKEIGLSRNRQCIVCGKQ